MTNADRASVVVTTRSCRDRRQRKRRFSARSRCHFRAALSSRLARRGSRRPTTRTGRDCRTILYQPRRFFRGLAGLFLAGLVFLGLWAFWGLAFLALGAGLFPGAPEPRAAPPAPGSLRPCWSAAVLGAVTPTIVHREQHKPSLQVDPDRAGQDARHHRLASGGRPVTSCAGARAGPGAQAGPALYPTPRTVTTISGRSGA